jgi:hypothetical protein
VNKQLITIALASYPILWGDPSLAEQQRQITFTGKVLPQCAILMVNERPNSIDNPRFSLIGDRGSITTLCNTSSTLSISVDRTVQLAKIRFAVGGTGIYANADRHSSYAATIKFSTNAVTSAIGDTAQIEVDSTTRDKSIVVYASLTP